MSKFDDFDVDKIIENKINRTQKPTWYVYGTCVDKKGRTRSFLWGPYPDWHTANSIAESSNGVQSHQCEDLGTSDIGKANQILRHRKIKRGANVSEMFDRVSHTH